MDSADPTTWPDIPGYTLVDVAGLGGGGMVFRAVEATSGRTVAVKSMLRPDRQEKLNQFRNEARILANLEHPHILPIYDFGVIDDRPFLVNRFARGGSVADRIDLGPIPLEKAVEWSIHIAEALDWAHTQGLLHRDVKPSNMLLDETDQIYLSDFGLAGGFDEEALSQAGSALYLSPERGKGESRIDVTADIYALAVSLFEMVTGQPPYLGDSPLAIRVMHIEEPVPSARDLRPEVTIAVDDLIQWSMSKDPEERPPSASTFAAAARVALSDPDQKVKLPSYLNLESTPVITSLEDDFPPTVRDSSSVGPPLRSSIPQPRRSTRLYWLLGGVAGLLMVALLTGLFLLLNPEEFPIVVETQEVPTPLPPALSTPVGRLLFDDFSDEATSNDAIDEARLVSGALQIETSDPQFRIFWPTEQIQADRVHVELLWLPSDRSSQFEFGVLCRWQDVDHFDGLVVVVDDEGGRVEVWSVRNGTLEILTSAPLDPEVVRRDQAHRVAADCLSNRYLLAINEEVVLSAANPSDSFERGDVAILTRPLGQDKHIIRLDDLLVEDPS